MENDRTKKLLPDYKVNDGTNHAKYLPDYTANDKTYKSNLLTSWLMMWQTRVAS
jgi:hypothetical protein